MKIIKPALLLLIIIIGCQSKNIEELNTLSDSEPMIRANELAQKFIIVDGHVDLPYRLKESNFDVEKDKNILLKTDTGDFDYERAIKGGLNAPFMSIYIPASYQATGGAKELADSLIDMVYAIATKLPEKFAVAFSPEAITENFYSDIISLPIGIENGVALEDDLENVKYFYDRGVRYITLTHSLDNLICDSSYDTACTWNGLSPYGKEVIQKMNEVGMMIDVSHISDSAFYQVMTISQTPVIASHSSCRHFTPGFERNMSDEMIKLLGEKGGVIQINFGSAFIDKKSRAIRDHMSDYLKKNNLKAVDPSAQAYIAEYLKANSIFSTVEKVADHIDHVVKVAGIDHVGLGSDFDGVGDTLPEGIKDVSQYPNLIFELLKRGYSDEDIEKVCYKNVFRVWNDVNNYAKTGGNHK